jgi:hypothetical protein
MRVGSPRIRGKDETAGRTEAPGQGYLELDVVQVSRQLGHARPSITLDVYAHLFEQARHADDIRNRMAQSSSGRLLGG